MLAHARDERRTPGPARRVDREPRECGVAARRRDREISDAEGSEQESRGGELALEVVEAIRDVLTDRLLDDRLVRRLAEDAATDHPLVEERPDQHVAKTCVRELLEQPDRARSDEFGDRSAGCGTRSSKYSQITVESQSVTSPSIRTGIRRRGEMRVNASPPKNGTIGSIS